MHSNNCAVHVADVNEWRKYSRYCKNIWILIGNYCGKCVALLMGFANKIMSCIHIKFRWKTELVDCVCTHFGHTHESTFRKYSKNVHINEARQFIYLASNIHYVPENMDSSLLNYSQFTPCNCVEKDRTQYKWKPT